MEKYDIKCILFHVGEKGKTSHKAVNLQSFIDTLQKPVIQERLKDGKLLGLLTHDGRDTARQAHIPHHDMVMKDPDLCNVLRKVTIKDGTVYAYLDLIKSAPAAQRFMSLWKMGSKIGVSMSTELIEKDEFYIQDLLGVDATLRAEFDSPIVEANFSENSKHTIETNWDTIQMGATVDPSEKVLLGNFSENPVSEPVEKKTSNGDFSEEKKAGDFSIREFLRERQRQPAMVLKQRIQEVIRYIRMSTSKSVATNAVFLRRYLLEYINEWILMSVSTPSSDLNISLGLRLTEYCKDRMPMRSLQLALRKARAQMEQSHSMTKNIQSELNSSFASVMNQIYDYVNEKVGNADKKI